MILLNYKTTVEKIYQKLTDLGVDTSLLRIDHIGYQADSRLDYDKKIAEVAGKATKVSENIVGGRRVGVFTIEDPRK